MNLKFKIILIIFLSLVIAAYLILSQENSVQFMINGRPLANEHVFYYGGEVDSKNESIVLDKDGKVHFPHIAFQSSGFMFNSKAHDVGIAGNLKSWGKTVYNFDKKNNKTIFKWSYSYLIFDTEVSWSSNHNENAARDASHP